MTIVRYNAQWGDHVLDATEISVESGRDTLTFEPVRGDGGLTLDRGPVLRRATDELVWLARDETDDPGARRDAFRADVDAGLTALYWHPMDGAFPAKVGRIGEQYVNDSIVDSVELIEDRDSGFAVIEPQAGSAPRAGADTVAVAADAADEALAALELEDGDAAAGTAVTTRARTLARAWQDAAVGDGRVDARRVYVDLAETQQGVDELITALSLPSDLARYGAYVALVELGSELARAAEAATSAVAATYEYRLDRSQGLLSLVVEQYGAVEAQHYYELARALTRIDRPLVIGAGTILTLPLP